jgi:hypothetical protein
MDPSEQMIMAFSSVLQFQIHLSTTNANETTLNLIVHVRDTLDCLTSVNLSSITITTDLNSLKDLIEIVQNPSSLSMNPAIQLLSSGNQNIVGQLITSFSHQFNRMHSTQLKSARSSKLTDPCLESRETW